MTLWKNKDILSSKSKWYKSLGIAALSGFIMAISQPTLLPGMSSPFAPGLLFSFLAFIGLIPIYLHVWDKKFLFVLKYSFVSGLFYFIISIYWVVIAMHVYGRLHYALSIIGLILLSGYCAISWAGGITFSEFFRKRLGIPVFYTLPVAWTAFEYFRNYLFTGFPWSQLGYTQSANFYFIQIADIFGIYGVTFAVALIAGALIHLVTYFRALHHKSPMNAIATLVIAFAIIYGYGALRSHDINESLQKADTVRIALLQGNVDQNKKMHSRKYRRSILKSYISLARKADKAKAELIIWPEASYPRTFKRDTKNLEKSPLGHNYQFSAAQYIGFPLYFWEGEGENKKRRLLNSSFLVDKDLVVLDRYDKSHLVPFGEYVPLEKFLPIDKLVPGLGTFQPGEEVRPLSLGRMKFGSLICYEGIFPEISREHTQKGAEFLINITNDAWYGLSSAPYQHLQFYRMRAIEMRRSIARAANTGVSTLISATGEIRQPTKLFVNSLVMGDIERLNIRSVYLIIGDILPQVCWALIFILSFIMLGMKRK